MIQFLTCNFLIGLPGSGKSTFASKLQSLIPNSVVVSSDDIREKIYGDASIQGDWNNKIEPEILRQIIGAIASDKPVIYDATNAMRHWRMGILMKIESQLEAKGLAPVYWQPWQLVTTPDVCKIWNQQRSRHVKEDAIDRYAKALYQFAPDTQEGFIRRVHQVSATKESTAECPMYRLNGGKSKLEDLVQIKYDPSKKQNRNNRYVWHQYSQLLDFERLMHLMSTIIRYPGIGNLSQTEPETLKQALNIEKLPKFDSPVAEIAKVIAKEYAPLYADTQAIKRDLSWLEANGLIGNNSITAELQIDILDDSKSTENYSLYSHRFSNLDAFTRLIKTIRVINYYPFLTIAGKTAIEEKIEIEQEYSETVRLTAVVEKLIEHQVFDRQEEHKHSGAYRKRVEGCFRADLRELKPYRILHDPFNRVPYSTKFSKMTAMKQGYFIGTGIFSQQELNELFNLLRSQSEKQHFNEPLAQEMYQNFRHRMEQTKLWQESAPYPTKVIGSKSVVNFERNTKNLRRFEVFEWAIKQREIIKIEHVKQQDWGDNSLNSDQKPYTPVIHPLQIVFHRQAWYLGYEIARVKENFNQGLFCFARIDRLQKIEKRGERTPAQQAKSLDKLTQLYQGSAGIFLGGSVQQQQTYLSASKRSSVEMKVEIYATDKSFNFFKETSQRFAEGQMRMTKPSDNQGDYRNSKIYSTKLKQVKNQLPHGNRVSLTLPKWSVRDIELIKWLVSWGGEIKVTEPVELIREIKARGLGIQQIYSNINLIVCDWNEVTELCLSEEVRHLSGYIAIADSATPEHQIVSNINRSQRNLCSLDLADIDSEIAIEKAVQFVTDNYSKYESRSYTNILIYCSQDKKVAHSLAGKIYLALANNKATSKLKISLKSHIDFGEL